MKARKKVMDNQVDWSSSDASPVLKQRCVMVLKLLLCLKHLKLVYY